MDELLDNLCTILDHELERQENVRDLCRAQQDAAREKDLEELSTRTVALQLLLRDAMQAEAERHRVLRNIVELLELPRDRQSLSHLIQAAPQPYKGRLEFLQLRLQRVMYDTRLIARDTSLLMRRSLRIVGQCLHLFHEAAPSQARYTAHGQEQSAARGPAVLLNQKG